MINSILIVSDEPDHQLRLTNCLLASGLSPVCCCAVADARILLAEQTFSAVLANDRLPDGDLRALVAALCDYRCGCPIIVVSTRGDWGTYSEAIETGAFDYVVFPPNPGELERVLWNAITESARSLLFANPEQLQGDLAKPPH
jgi:two-component system, OmpR family, response regulator